MVDMQREKPTQAFSIKVDGDKVYSVSTEKYNYMATDGYNCIVTREMDINEHKLAELIEGIKTDISEYPKQIADINEELDLMNKELDEIKSDEYWQLVKDNWERFSKIYGGIQKESKLFEKENELKRVEIQSEYDVKVLANYEEVLEKMQNNGKDNEE